MDMGPATILLGVAFPVLIGIGVALAVSDANEFEFWVARACFALAAIDALGFTIAWLWVEERTQIWKIVLGALIGASSVVLLVYGLKWIDYRQDRAATHLRPGKKPMPAMPENCNPPNDTIALFFGNFVAWSTAQKIRIIDMGELQMLTITRDSEGPRIRIDVLRIFDDVGSLIARIDEGTIWVAPSVRWSKPNASTLIVYDRRDMQVLKLEFVNSRAFYIEGLFRDQRGNSIQIFPDRVVMMPNNAVFNGPGCFGGNLTGLFHVT